MIFEVVNADCLDHLRTLPANTVDSFVQDPPYGLSFMGRGWDHAVPGPEFFVEQLRVAKPGAFLAAFGGTRTYHRLACAIEDAGWELRDCLSWIFGSGFPKSHDVSKGIDKAAGAEREVVGPNPTYRRDQVGAPSISLQRNPHITAPATDLARKYDGFGTALKPGHEPVILARKPLSPQQLLAELIPATQEAICRVSTLEKTDTSSFAHLQASGFLSTARWLLQCLDVLSGAASMCTTETASGLTTDLRILRSSLSRITHGITIEGSTLASGHESSAMLAAAISTSVQAKCERLVSTTAGAIAIDWRADEGSAPAGGDFTSAWEPVILARKPLIGTVAANYMAHGVGGLNIDGCRIGGEGGGTHCTNRDPAGRCKGHRNAGQSTSGETVHSPEPKEPTGRWPANLILDPEAGAMLDEQTGNLGKSTGGLSPGGVGAVDGMLRRTGGYLGANAGGLGDSGGASRFFYCAKSSRSEREAGLEHFEARTASDGREAVNDTAYQRDATARRNTHPTVKPIALMAWLCKLITPPGGLVVDPFCGSGSTGCAAVQEGFRFLGIEQTPEHADIARARIAHWNGDPIGHEPQAPEPTKPPPPKNQMELFA